MNYTIGMRYALLLLALIAMPSRSGDFVSGSRTCVATGNTQVSATSYNVYALTISANIGNAGRVYLGGSTVSTTTGGVLVAGASYTVSRPSAAVNPATLYFACSTASDGITWIGSR